MPELKPPYQITFKLTTARADVLSEAVQRLHQLTADHDQSGEATATFTIKGFKESDLRAIREDFELFLYRHEVGIDCEVKTKSPGLRQETVEAIKNHKTPMDALLGFADKYGVERIEINTPSA